MHAIPLLPCQSHVPLSPSPHHSSVNRDPDSLGIELRQLDDRVTLSNSSNSWPCGNAHRTTHFGRKRQCRGIISAFHLSDGIVLPSGFANSSQRDRNPENVQERSRVLGTVIALPPESDDIPSMSKRGD